MDTKLLGLCAFLISISACVNTPSQPKIQNAVWLDQGWTDKQPQKFHHESQDTATLPVPYEWFMALEQPTNPVHWYKGTAKTKFSSTSYLSKFGYIPSKKTPLNPDNLPVGFAKTSGLPDLVNGGTYNAIGLTCAGCHTGQMSYQGTNIRIDGAPAVTDITTMIGALGISIIETAADPIRLVRFKNSVI